MFIRTSDTNDFVPGAEEDKERVDKVVEVKVGCWFN
jgi:hypothetical protein